MAEPALRLLGQPPVEIIEAGAGRPVVLLHSSASGARQWEVLIGRLARHRRVIAPNLLGYGRTDPRDAAARASAAGQAGAVLDMLGALPGLGSPVDIVGHSFGGVVALALAAALGDRAGRVFLFEPNAFGLLAGAGTEPEWQTVTRLHAAVRALSARGAWLALAALFADSFSGEGTWAAMPPARRTTLAAALRYNADEWAAVMPPALDASPWRAIRGPVTLARSRDTTAPLRAVAEVLHRRHPDWARLELARGGHLAPLTRPRPFNAAVAEFLGVEPPGAEFPGI